MKRLAAALVCAAGLAHAHSFDPSLLDLREREGGAYDVVWKTPVPQGEGAQPTRALTPVFGAACRNAGDVSRSGAAEGIIVFRIECGPRGLRGQTISVAGLAGNPADVLVRIRWADGSLVTSVLRSGAAEWEIPDTGAGQPFGTVFRRYAALGVEHILAGTDHLAFVLGLLLLVRGFGRLVQTITAFTAAHTITLGLAVVGIVRMPSAPVEALIAVSIVLVAVEAIQAPGDHPTLAHRAPWVIAFLFGLLHGLGFAGALSELGLPPDHVPTALLAFNVGVELGQLLFVAVMVGPVLLPTGP